MNIPLFAWCVVAATMLILVVTRSIVAFGHHAHSHKQHSGHHSMYDNSDAKLPHLKAFEIGSESEEIYVPGDKKVTLKDYSDEYAD